MNSEQILKNVFNENVKILKKLQTGFRCQTFLIENEKNKYIFQIYMENTKYQARKKYDILKKLDLNEIPKVYKYEEEEQYSYLISEYKEGISLTEAFKDSWFKVEYISYRLAYILNKIHSITKEKTFGWITDKDVLANEKFIDYIKLEYKRLIPDLEVLPKEILNKIINRVEEAIKIIADRTENKNISQLCWYDINPDNILVENNNKYCLKGFLDPGGARYGLAEWDLAFIKMELTRNELEFNSIINDYEVVSNRKVDLELLNALSIIVELNDISFILVDKAKLPIPYDSNFKSELEYIYNNIIN